MMRFVCLTSPQSPVAKALKNRHPQLVFDQPKILLKTRWAHYVYLPLFNYQYLSVDWLELGVDLNRINDVFFVSPRAVESFAQNLSNYHHSIATSHNKKETTQHPTLLDDVKFDAATTETQLIRTWNHAWMAQRQCYAVGQKTAQAIYQYFGINTVVAPKHNSGEHALAETILDKQCLTSFKSRHILWLRGTDDNKKSTGNGAEELLNQLKQYALQLNVVATYQRLSVGWSAALSDCSNLTEASKTKTAIYYWDMLTHQAPKIIQTRWMDWCINNKNSIKTKHKHLAHHKKISISVMNNEFFQSSSIVVTQSNRS